MEEVRDIGIFIAEIDAGNINAARNYLDQASETHFEWTIDQLSNLLINKERSPLVRMEAGLQLKNVLFSNDSEQKVINRDRWLDISAGTRNGIKRNCLDALGTQPDQSVSQCVAAIATIDIYKNAETDVIQSLVNRITAANSSNNLKKACFETIGCICIEIDLSLRSIYLKELECMMTGIIHGMNDIDNIVKMAATTALLNINRFKFDRWYWTNVIKSLVTNIRADTSSKNVKKLSLGIIGYTCNKIDLSFMSIDDINILLRAVIPGMNEMQNSDKMVATTALLNSLEFTRHNFENEKEREYIMQTVCKTTQCTDKSIAVVALQCLVKIMNQYYAFMKLYMQRAYEITVEAMKSEDDGIQMQGIEFWSTVSKKEIDLALEVEKCTERCVPITVVSKNYSKVAFKFILPLILQICEKQADGEDFDEWSPHNAAGVCIRLLSQACGDSIIPEVLPYIKSNIQSPIWQQRETAIVAFGSILEGPSTTKLRDIVAQAMSIVITLLVVDVAVVRDSAAWAVGRVCEIIPEVPLMEESLPVLLRAMVSALPGEPRVATNVCWAFASLADAAYLVGCSNFKSANNEGDNSDHKEPDTYKLSPFLADIVQQLIATTERNDCAQTNLRKAAYSALMGVMKSAPKDCYPCVLQTTELVVIKLQSIFPVDWFNLSTQDRQQLYEHQSLLCGTLNSVLRKMTKLDACTISDLIMTELMAMLREAQLELMAPDFSNKFSAMIEDALLAVGALIDAIDTEFIKYLQPFMEILRVCLQNPNEVLVCSNAIGILSDLSRNIGEAFTSFLGPIFTMLDEILIAPGTNKTFYPQIITTFGDFALQLGCLLGHLSANFCAALISQSLINS